MQEVSLTGATMLPSSSNGHSHNHSNPHDHGSSQNGLKMPNKPCCDKPHAASEYATHLSTLGVAPFMCIAEESELAKLFSTTYYAKIIKYHTDVARVVEKNGLNFYNVMTHWNKGYNAGYRELNMPHVGRPTLTPMVGTFGGHCLGPNANILHEFSPESRSVVADLMPLISDDHKAFLDNAK